MDSDMHEAIFVWPEHDAQDVVLTGTFDQWTSSIPLTKTPRGFEGKVKLPWGDRVLYKFVVDGRWRTTQSQPEEKDSSGNVNNVYICPSKFNLEAQTLVVNEIDEAEVPASVPVSAVEEPTAPPELSQVDHQVEQPAIPSVQDIPEAISLSNPVDTTVTDLAVELGKEEGNSTQVPDQVKEKLPQVPLEATETASQAIDSAIVGGQAVVVPEVAPEVLPGVVPTPGETSMKEGEEFVGQPSQDKTGAPLSSTFDDSNQIPIQAVTSIPEQDTTDSTQTEQNPAIPSLSAQLAVEPEPQGGTTIVESELSDDALTGVPPELPSDAPTDAEPESEHKVSADVEPKPQNVTSDEAFVLHSSEDVAVKVDAISEKETHVPTHASTPDILVESADKNAHPSPDDTTNESATIDLTVHEPLEPSKATPAPATETSQTTVVSEALAEDEVLDMPSQVPTIVTQNQPEPQELTTSASTEPETVTQVAAGVDSKEEATVPNVPTEVQPAIATGDVVRKDQQPTGETTETVKPPEVESVAAIPAVVPVDTSDVERIESATLDTQPVQTDSKKTATSDEATAEQSVDTAPSPPTVDDSPNGDSLVPVDAPTSVSEPPKPPTPIVSDAAATKPTTTPPETIKSGSARKKRLSIFGKLKNMFLSD